MKSLKERTEIQQAYLDGAEIQCKTNTMILSKWGEAKTPQFEWHKTDYRVKREPVVVWVNIYSNARLCAHTTEEEALRLASVGTSARREAVKFIEVIE